MFINAEWYSLILQYLHLATLHVRNLVVSFPKANLVVNFHSGKLVPNAYKIGDNRMVVLYAHSVVLHGMFGRC